MALQLLTFSLLFFQFCSSIPDNKDFHSPSVVRDSPYLYCVMARQEEKPLSCPPTIKLVKTIRGGKTQRYLLRGDSEGYVNIWTVPDISVEQIKVAQSQNKQPQSK